MKWGALFNLLAGIGAWGCREIGTAPGKILLGWVSLAFLGAGMAYWLNAPQVLGKRPDGRLAVWSWVWLWPYHLLSHLSLGFHRLSAAEPPFQEIRPGLFLGGCLRPKDARQLDPQGVATVLDLTSEFAECATLRRSGRYRCRPLLDHTAPSRQQLLDAVTFITEHLVHPPVYVHCAVGHGRSATVVAAFLLAKNLAGNPEEAVLRLKSRRPGVRLNAGQMQALRQFHRSLQVPPEVASLPAPSPSEDARLFGRRDSP